jgi:predicted 3-demethylubiquinone-9 3-methyltransferase (glyoxalase superfamily)
MQKITPFLWFDNQAEEAAKFYVSVFKKDSKIIGTTHYGEAGPGLKGSVLTVKFQIAEQEFIALNGGPMFKFNESVSFVVNCETQEEIDYFWEKLTAGGGEESRCGWLSDKFGLSWQVVPALLQEMMLDKDEAKSNRVMEAILKMDKLDLATLKRAYEG